VGNAGARGKKKGDLAGGGRNAYVSFKHSKQSKEKSKKRSPWGKVL